MAGDFKVMVAATDDIVAKIGVFGPCTLEDAHAHIQDKFRNAHGLDKDVEISSMVLFEEKTRAKADRALGTLMSTIEMLKAGQEVAQEADIPTEQETTEGD